MVVFAFIQVSKGIYQLPPTPSILSPDLTANVDQYRFQGASLFSNESDVK